MNDVTMNPKFEGMFPLVGLDAMAMASGKALDSVRARNVDDDLEELDDEVGAEENEDEEDEEEDVLDEAEDNE